MTAVLWHEGVHRIDTLVLSHADTDHFNAVPELLDRFDVGEIVVPPPFLASDSWAVTEVLRQAHTAGIPVRTTQAGDSFALDPHCRIRVLHPSREIAGMPVRDVALNEAVATDNETSLVLAVESAGRRMLLTGDIEGESLARFLDSAPGSCDVLVAPHHGSRTSLPATIGRVTAADWVIVSGAGAAGWPEVRDAYAAARKDNIPVSVVKTGTDVDTPGGAIAVVLTASAVRVTQFVRGRWQDVPAGLGQEAPDKGIGAPDGSPATPGGSPATPGGSRDLHGNVHTSPERERWDSPSLLGRVSAQPAAITSNWLATKPASSSNTPLVNP